jgi:hypothetical protein
MTNSKAYRHVITDEKKCKSTGCLQPALSLLPFLPHHKTCRFGIGCYIFQLRPLKTIPLVAFSTVKLSFPMAVPYMLCTDICCAAISESQTVPGLSKDCDVSFIAILQYIFNSKWVNTLRQ